MPPAARPGASTAPPPRPDAARIRKHTHAYSHHSCLVRLPGRPCSARRRADQAGHRRALPHPGRRAAGRAGRPRRARPRPHRQREDHRVLAAAGRPTLREARRPAPRSPPRAGAGSDPRAGDADRGRARPDRLGGRPERHHDLRRRLAEAAGGRAARRRRHRRGLPRPARGPALAARPHARGHRDHGARRGRPHGRHGLPARRHPHHDPHAGAGAAPALQRDAGQRRGQAGSPASCIAR